MASKWASLLISMSFTSVTHADAWTDGWDKKLQESWKDFQEHRVYDVQRLALKGGLGASHARFHNNSGTTDGFVGPGFNTHFSYTFLPWELGLSSYIFFGKVEQFPLTVDSTQVVGDGSVRTLSISPILRYVSSKSVRKHWFWTFGGGPVWSQHSFALRAFTDNQGQYRKNHKLSYETFGGLIALGAQEILPYKQMHPVFWEFVFIYEAAHKTTLVDANDFTEVQTIGYDNRPKDIRNQILMINMGLTLF